MKFFNKNPLTNPKLHFNFVEIKPNFFYMKHGDDISLVQITKPFEIQTTQVTQRLYEEIMGKNPSYFNNNLDNPVEMVSWNDCQAFVKKLNKRDSNYTYRLPTEAEWCLAENGEKGDDGNAWHSNNSNGTSHPVALKKPNEFGLYDMHGNVWEWLEDWYDEINEAFLIDPEGPKKGSSRVFRGGGWSSDARHLRSAVCNCGHPDGSALIVGFRLVRTKK